MHVSFGSIVVSSISIVINANGDAFVLLYSSCHLLGYTIWCHLPLNTAMCSTLSVNTFWPYIELFCCVGFLSLFAFLSYIIHFIFKVVEHDVHMCMVGFIFFLYLVEFIFFLLMALESNNNIIGIRVFSANFLHNPSGGQFINRFRNTSILFSLINPVIFRP